MCACAGFCLSRDTNDTIGKIRDSDNPAKAFFQSRLPPGAGPPASKAASKNAKRRANAKAKEGDGAGAAAGVAGLKL